VFRPLPSPLEPSALGRGLVWLSIIRPDELKQRFSPNLYQKLLAHQSADAYHRNIAKDIHRTFPNLKLFNPPYNGRAMLSHVLKAYTVYDLDIGYSQGMGFLVGMLMLHISDEETVFWCFVHLMFAKKYNFRLLYQGDCQVLKIMLIQFDACLKRHRPALYAHMSKEGIDSSMYATQWFLTIFSYRLPLPVAGLAWDLFLDEGFKAVFQIGLEIFAMLEDELMGQPFERMLPIITKLPEIPPELIYRAKRLQLHEEEYTPKISSK